MKQYVVSCCGLTEFDGAIHAQQDVVALDVSMDDLVRVEELQRLETLEEGLGWRGQRFCQCLFLF